MAGWLQATVDQIIADAERSGFKPVWEWPRDLERRADALRVMERARAIDAERRNRGIRRPPGASGAVMLPVLLHHYALAMATCWALSAARWPS